MVNEGTPLTFPHDYKRAFSFLGKRVASMECFKYHQGLDIIQLWGKESNGRLKIMMQRIHAMAEELAKMRREPCDGSHGWWSPGMEMQLIILSRQNEMYGKTFDEIRKQMKRFDVEWLLYENKLVNKLEPVVLLEREWFKETAAADGIFVKPFFERFDKLVAKYRRKVDEGGTQSDKIVDQNGNHQDSEQQKGNTAEEAIDLLLGAVGGDPAPTVNRHSSSALQMSPQNYQYVFTEEQSQEMSLPAKVTGTKEEVTKFEIDVPSTQLSSLSLHHQNGFPGNHHGSDSQSAEIGDNEENPSTNRASTQVSYRHRRCSNEECFKVEKTPHEFDACLGCKLDSQKFPRKVRKSYYCSEACYGADWKLKHKKLHKERRRRLREEMELEGKNVEKEKQG